MNQKVNEAYKDLFLNKIARYIILMGGRGAGRSTAGSQYATAHLVGPDYFRCAIMRYVLGDIRNSIFQDIYDRIEENELLEAVKIREHLLTFEYGKNKINGIGFKRSSGEQKSKLKSLSNYNKVIIEEADEVIEEDFIQLDDSLRTTKSNVQIILQLNTPDKNHWIIKRWFNLVKSEVEGFYNLQLKESVKHDTVFIHTSYLDNIANIAPSTARNYENYKIINPEHYYNMIRGMVSEGVRGRIFRNWKPISSTVYEKLPFDEFHGLDFGFKNDPNALISMKKHNNKLYLREKLYEIGLITTEMDAKFKDIGIKKNEPIFADRQEARLIAELASMGWDIFEAEKNAGSVKEGIDEMLGLEIYYTEDSVNLIKEMENYHWALDRNKNPTNTPIDKWNHAMDAIRYGLKGKSAQSFVGFV